jgi:hypothetical protein
MSKFSDFLAKHGIDSRRVLVASKTIETLRPEDRAIKLRQRQMRKKEEKPTEENRPKKPRSGRPLAGPSLQKALSGEALSGAAKSRILRAVNAVLLQKKKAEASLNDLF